MSNVIDFDGARFAPLLMQAINGFSADPPDTEFQRGYLAALIWAYREGLGRGEGDARLELAESILRG
jgi:hypothetical protein